MTIKNIVVVGAGTMGGGIAAHCANSGFNVTLLDITAAGGDPNTIVQSLWDKQLKMKPAALMNADAARLVVLGNLDDDLKLVKDADWIIEVIIEQLQPKRDLMKRIDALRKPDSIVSSNTSGIPIHAIAEGLSEGFRTHFCGTHFFNPPRYLKLLEVIPTADTLPEIIQRVTKFAEDKLGKSVVVCKDTPNFIANRIGSFVGQYRALAAIDNDYTVEETDALCGPIIGNPKTGVFRLSDVVGIDVWGHVTRNLYELVPDDESREIFKLAGVVEKVIQNKWLGNKTGQGFYKTVKAADGSREFHALNLKTLEYSPSIKVRFDVIGELKDLPLSERLHELFTNPKWQEDRGGGFIIETTLPILAYSARRIPEIANTPFEIDRAMELGYATESGPFKTWDAIGVAHGIELMKARDIAVPTWVDHMLSIGHQTFYQTIDGRTVGVYDPVKATYVPVDRHKLNIILSESSGTQRELKRNASASLLDLGDGVLCLEFHSKGNTIDQFALDMGKAALDTLTNDAWRGLVIANQGKEFSLGANIGMFIMALGDLTALEKAVRTAQYAILDFRFAPKPVVAAPRQRVLGGGTEICMAASRMVVAAETYMGLPEIGVGIIPGWGGCKELLRRNVSPHMTSDKVDALEHLQKVFETIAYAKIGESAAQVRRNGFLTDADVIVPNDEHLIGYAKQTALAMADAGYVPPSRDARSVYAIGSRGKAAMTMAVESLRWGKFISAHDALIAKKLTHVLCGGDLTAPTWVTEDYILDLEREAELSLFTEPKTQERITFMLKNAKPLRN